jgi:CENP-B N-terminal DNA-binding domain.
MSSKDPKVCNQGTANKRKHVILTVPQKLEVIRRLENGESQREVTASHDNGFSTMI